MHFTTGPRVRGEMLAALGMRSEEELFADVPTSVRATIPIAKGLTEPEARARLRRTFRKNRPFEGLVHFLGAGAYVHHVPAEVRYLVSRSEFMTSYTPYQAEASQGMLQAMFEYQTFVCRLTGMDAANASMYDGASALGEAGLMAARQTDRPRILVPRALASDKRSTLENYVAGSKCRVEEVPFDRATGRMDVAAVERALGDDVACVYVESPNLFGVIEEDLARIGTLAHAKGALLVVGVNPISLGLLKPPSAFGADIVIGEGQPLGQAVDFGGPYLGLFACRTEFLRQMPGRIVGETVDKEGNRAFCLTLQTREQHIRRTRATSNICTNEGLNALAATVFLAVLGEQGFSRLARLCAARARDLARRIAEVRGFEAPYFRAHHFHEFVVRSQAPVATVNEALLDRGLFGGLDLTAAFPELGNAAVWCVTDAHPLEAFSEVVAALKEARA